MTTKPETMRMLRPGLKCWATTGGYGWTLCEIRSLSHEYVHVIFLRKNLGAYWPKTQGNTKGRRLPEQLRVGDMHEPPTKPTPAEAEAIVCAIAKAIDKK